MINEMENYGLCGRVEVRASGVYDGEVTISGNNANVDGTGRNMKLRVYEKMRNNVQGLNKINANKYTNNDDQNDNK